MLFETGIVGYVNLSEYARNTDKSHFLLHATKRQFLPALLYITLTNQPVNQLT